MNDDAADEAKCPTARPTMRNSTKRETAASKEARPYRFRGGDACESNAPETFCAPHNGFEGRGGHQAPSISVFQPDPC